ncbi:hypothetical protein Si067_00901 [Streptococcus infantarius subsp. infantarius]|nr:hypothetical protein [Streptococcus infantarius subsp. infantarius]MCO4550857.1 hypothetical protein [Streptococcus infantarius subsp. infantarius]MCO4586526.1 hypothetical protein [Streptococcus infantarius subsp. infantarius]MCO4594190.1 hypothetical protein [Streptococcus infantarius subsp. infantarius]MCO4610760.1 hypothetical protein [Streptococcus infantarius subsp. infantarius]
MRLALFGQNLIKFQERNMEHLNESIQSNLALEIAQLTLDKATLKAQVDYLTKQNAELQQQLDEATAPQN